MTGQLQTPAPAFLVKRAHCAGRRRPGVGGPSSKASWALVSDLTGRLGRPLSCPGPAERVSHGRESVSLLGTGGGRGHPSWEPERRDPACAQVPKPHPAAREGDGGGAHGQGLCRRRRWGDGRPLGGAPSSAVLELLPCHCGRRLGPPACPAPRGSRPPLDLLSVNFRTRVPPESRRPPVSRPERSAGTGHTDSSRAARRSCTHSPVRLLFTDTQPGLTSRTRRQGHPGK